MESPDACTYTRAACLHFPPSSSCTGMPACFPLISHNAMSTPESALFRTGPSLQYELSLDDWNMSSISLTFRPSRNGAKYLSTASTTASGRWVNVAHPSPVNPGSLVSILTTISRIPAGAVQMLRIFVMDVIGSLNSRIRDKWFVKRRFLVTAATVQSRHPQRSRCVRPL